MRFLSISSLYLTMAKEIRNIKALPKNNANILDILFCLPITIPKSSLCNTIPIVNMINRSNNSKLKQYNEV